MISIAKKYREALAKFHREFPATDSIPSNKIGTFDAAIEVFLEKSALTDNFLRFWDETADGNGYRAFIEDLNWHKFYKLASREAGDWDIQPPDERAPWKDVEAWEWFNTTDGQEEDFLDGVWDAFSQRWREYKEWKEKPSSEQKTKE